MSDDNRTEDSQQQPENTTSAASPDAGPPSNPETADGPAPPSSAGPQKGPGGRGAQWLALLALLMAAAALALGIHLWLENRDREDPLTPVRGELEALREAHRELGDRLERVRSAQRTQRERLGETRSELQGRTLELEQRQLRFSEQLQELTHSDRRGWLLAEAEYLMRLAGQRLLMARDVRGSLQLLRNADNTLSELDDSGLNPVRAALTEEISALRAATGIDREGRYFQLQAVARRTGELELHLAPGREHEAAQATEPDGDEETPERRFAGLTDALSRLGDYIRLERREEAYRPLISPLHENALRYSLQLQFEQAQLALLAGDPRIYEHTLQRATEWIDRYYLLDDRADAVIAQIEELRGQPVSVELPDISTSLHRLRQYRETVEGDIRARRTEDDSE